MFTVVGAFRWELVVKDRQRIRYIYVLAPHSGFPRCPPGDEADYSLQWEQSLVAHSTLSISPLEVENCRSCINQYLELGSLPFSQNQYWLVSNCKDIAASGTGRLIIPLHLSTIIEIPPGQGPCLSSLFSNWSTVDLNVVFPFPFIQWQTISAQCLLNKWLNDWAKHSVFLTLRYQCVWTMKKSCWIFILKYCSNSWKKCGIFSLK